MDTYTVLMFWGDTFEMRAAFEDASAPIIVDGETSPFQVADAQHCPHKAAALIVEHAGPDFFGYDDDDLSDALDSMVVTHG